jgi:hypothetical protein
MAADERFVQAVSTFQDAAFDRLADLDRPALMLRASVSASRSSLDEELADGGSPTADHGIGDTRGAAPLIGLADWTLR